MPLLILNNINIERDDKNIAGLGIVLVMVFII